MQPTLLIASPQTRDPFFERTVVLVFEHNEHGAVGVVVNRQLQHKVEDVLDLADGPDLTTFGTVPVVWGGPVATHQGTVVTGAHLTEEEPGWKLPNGIAVTRSQDALLRLLDARAPMILCLGYAGWGAGQLDREIALGGWLWTDCDARIVFDTPAEERWNKALATLGLTPGVVWMQPVNE